MSVYNTQNCDSYFNVALMYHTGLEDRDYGRRRSAVLTLRYPSIRKSWH
jgi:hypothetical protein